MQLPNTADLQLLRARVRLFLKVMFFLHLGFNMVSGTLRRLLIDSVPLWPRNRFDVVRVASFAITALLGVAWIWCTRRELSRQALSLVETVGTVLLCGGYVLYLLFGPRHPFVVPSVLMMIAMALVLRAVLVPSLVGRTLVVSLPPLLSLALLAAFVRPAEPVAGAWVGLFGAAVIVLALVASRVIYQLREAVSQARQLGQYVLGRKLGEGANGAVYEATHVMMRRPTAIKLLPVSRAGETALARFEREVNQTSRLNHPNSIRIYDYGRTPDGIFYFAMELLEGVTLGELVEHWGAQPQGRVRDILLQASHALAEAHALGMVHRDIKPANMMLCNRGGVADTVKVLDFGLVKPLPHDALKSSVTKTDTIVGTPNFMAPEAFTHPDEVGTPADIYGVAAIGYWLLTGQQLFPGDSMVEVGWQHINVPVTPPSERGIEIDPAFEALLLRCLHKQSEERPQDAAELSRLLEELPALDWDREQAVQWWGAQAAAVERLRGHIDVPASGERAGVDVDFSGRDVQPA